MKVIDEARSAADAGQTTENRIASHLRDRSLVSWGPVGVSWFWRSWNRPAFPIPAARTLLLLVFIAAARPRRRADARRWPCRVVGRQRVFLRGAAPRRRKIPLARYTLDGRGQRFRAWFMRYGMVTVFISALLPIPILPFKVFCACAGAMGVSRTRFMLVLAAARIPRYCGAGVSGRAVGRKLGSLAHEPHLAHGWPLAIALFGALYALLNGTTAGTTMRGLQ